METQTETNYTNNVLALAGYLKIDPEEIIETSWGFDADGSEYLVLTDSEADERVKEYIQDSLWAFNASFLASETGLPEEMFAACQDKCEGANDGFLKAVESTCGLDTFAESAVCADGRGHFLSSYDGEEIEAGDYFIYRTN